MPIYIGDACTYSLCKLVVYSSALRFCLFFFGSPSGRRVKTTVVEEFGERRWMRRSRLIYTGRLQHVMIHFSLVSSPSWMTFLTHMHLLSSNMQDAEAALVVGCLRALCDHTSAQEFYTTTYGVLL
jgi:hypothetical protein